MEKISSNSLKVVEMEKTNLQNSIHSVLVGLKNIETHLGSTHISFEQCFNELESREKHLISTEQSLSKATQQFELIRQSIEIKEKEFHGVQEEFAAEQKLLRESFSGKIEMGQSVYEAIQKWVGEKLAEIKVKQEFLEVRGKELDYKEEKLREKEKGMEMEFKKEIEVTKKKLDFANEFIQQIGKKLESDLVELELKDKELLGTQGAPPVSNKANTGSNRGQPQVSQQKQVPTKSCKLGARSSGPFYSFYLRSEANSSRKMVSEHVTRTRGTAEVGGGLKGIAHVNIEEGNTVDAAKTRESGTSRDGKRKRGRPPKRSHENTVEFDKKSVTLESGANKYNVIDDSESKPNLGSTSDPEVYECPDPEFSDFDKDKDEKCFSVDQIWACYDTSDGMPRFYAQVKKVLSRGFKLRITWLEADPEEQGEIDWVNEGLPVCCGKFTCGDTEETSDRLSFSHLIHFEKGSGRGSYLIYPRMGETWALFKDWEIGWSTDSENHKKYIFEIVEILSDFSHDTGIKVGYLRKMEGFVSLFQLITLGGYALFVIPSSEMLRFSHRVPSFKMTGAESEGVPEGSFELDPAALPTNLNELWQPEEEKVEAQRWIF